MNEVRFRCPHCKKLYVSYASQLVHGDNYFTCSECEGDFYFRREWIRNFMVSAKPLSQNSNKAQEEKLRIENLTSKTCAKCGAENRIEAKECRACQVIFEKILDLPLDPSLRATPSLVAKWKEVLTKYNDELTHERFISTCRERGALKYAEHLYQQVVKATNGDAIAERRLLQIERLERDLDGRGRQEIWDVILKFSQEQDWKKVAFWAPVVVSAIFILTGMVFSDLKNLISFGFSLFVLSSGFLYLVKDKLFNEE